MKPVNAKIPAKKKAGIVAMVALPKSFPSGMRRKTPHQFVLAAKRLRFTKRKWSIEPEEVA
jgi:hypothetical protein